MTFLRSIIQPLNFQDNQLKINKTYMWPRKLMNILGELLEMFDISSFLDVIDLLFLEHKKTVNLLFLSLCRMLTSLKTQASMTIFETAS